jgi:hypothetical protein
LEVLAIAAALAVLGAAPAKAPAAPPPAPFAWPTPDLIEAVDVQGPMSAEGIPLRLHAVKLKHTLEELAPLYLRAFKQAGFYVPPREHQVDLYRDPSLTALDTRKFISYTAIFQKNPDGTTTVILGEANLAQAKPSPSPPGLPMFEGASHVSNVHSEGSLVVSYDAAANPDAVRAFYREQLGKLGFASSAPASGDVFRKGDAELQLSVAPKKNGQAAVVLLLKQVAAAAPK